MPKKPSKHDVSNADAVGADVVVEQVTDDTPNADAVRAHGITEMIRLPDEALAEVADAMNAEAARLADEQGLDDRGNEPVARLVAPAPVKSSALLATKSVEWWRDERIPALDAEIAAAEQLLATLAAEAELVEDFVLLGLDGARAYAAEHRAKVTAAEATAAEAKARRVRAERQLEAAQQRMDAVTLAREAERARVLAGERAPLFQEYDAALAVVERALRAIHANTARLSGYAHVTSISANRMALRSKFLGAVFAAAPTFAKLLDLPRRESLLAYRPAAEAEARLWHHFLTGTAPPIAEAPKLAAPTRSLFPIAEVEEQHDTAETQDTEGVMNDQEPAAPVPCDHGVLVLQGFTSGGHTYREGDRVAAETVATWRPANVQAMTRVLRIQPLPAPAADSGDIADLLA